jgi:hypothetical protein
MFSLDRYPSAITAAREWGGFGSRVDNIDLPNSPELSVMIRYFREAKVLVDAAVTVWGTRYSSAGIPICRGSG